MSGGALEEWLDFLEDQVPEILRLVVDSWAEMEPPKPGEREDNISNRLCVMLQKNRSVREMMFYVVPQVVILEVGAGEELGRLDITFLPTGRRRVPDEDIYFCLECKRLNVVKGGTVRAYASEYVLFGMMRFVTGQYAKSVKHGGMVGYVLDGKVAEAMANVEDNVRTNHVKLCMQPPGEFEASVSRPADEQVRETHHERPGDAAPFRIHHIFVAGNTKLAALALATPARARRRPGKKSKKV